MKNIWFTSDLHFDHIKIGEKHPERPLQEKLIVQINSCVAPDDVLVILGDFCFPSGGIPAHYAHLLNGTRYLVQGNHDKVYAWSDLSRQAFEWIRIRTSMLIPGGDGMRLELSHEPLLTWSGIRYGRPNLHGHTHGRLTERRPLQLDVGIDNAHKILGTHRPFSIKEVLEIVEYQDAFDLSKGVTMPRDSQHETWSQ